MENKKTLKEWNKLVGGLLVNYDGFLPIYEKLTGDIPKTNIDYLEQRLKSAGELLCTREAFISGIGHCTIYAGVKDEEFEQVIPEYEEGRSVYCLIEECEFITEDYLEGNNSEPERIERIKKMIEQIMRYRKISRETYCMQDNNNIQKCLDEMEEVQEDEYVQFWVEEQKLPSEHFKDLIDEGKINTVEELEENLVSEISENLNNLDLHKSISREELKPILSKLYILSQAVIPNAERHQRIFGKYKCYERGTAISEHYDDFSIPTPLSRKEGELSSLEAEAKTISEAEALIDQQKEGQNVGEK